jgi:hypothetical protein
MFCRYEDATIYDVCTGIARLTFAVTTLSVIEADHNNKFAKMRAGAKP